MNCWGTLTDETVEREGIADFGMVVGDVEAGAGCCDGKVEPEAIGSVEFGFVVVDASVHDEGFTARYTVGLVVSCNKKRK